MSIDSKISLKIGTGLPWHLSENPEPQWELSWHLLPHRIFLPINNDIHSGTRAVWPYPDWGPLRTPLRFPKISVKFQLSARKFSNYQALFKCFRKNYKFRINHKFQKLVLFSQSTSTKISPPQSQIFDLKGIFTYSGLYLVRWECLTRLACRSYIFQ